MCGMYVSTVMTSMGLMNLETPVAVVNHRDLAWKNLLIWIWQKANLNNCVSSVLTQILHMCIRTALLVYTFYKIPFNQVMYR